MNIQCNLQNIYTIQIGTNQINKSRLESTISKNTSYIQNPDFPSTYSTTGTCSYKISKMNSSICQICLDFDTLVLDDNNPTGANAGCCGSTCRGVPADGLTVTGKTGWNPPNIYHTNTGYHGKIVLQLI